MSLIPLLPALLFAGGTPCQPLTCTVTPSVIQVGAFYDGARVKVEGRAAPGSKVIVTVTGSDHEEGFIRKTRFGPIWVSGGKLRISGAPSLFLRFSTDPVNALLSRMHVAKRGLDEASLMTRMRIEPYSPDRDDAVVRASYVALKASEGAYSFGDGGVVVTDSGEDTSYAIEFHWPKRAPPATYEVRVYEVAEGAVVREASALLPVVRTGFVAWLAGMAANRASVYGIVAVLIGALAGFGIDRLATLLFGKRRSVGH